MINNNIVNNDNKKNTWDKVLLARNNNRFKGLDLVLNIFDCFFELHGDRLCGDDKSIIGGLAFLKDIAVTVICQHKGKSHEETILRNYGMTMPEGYRKALRLMKQAEKFSRPVICLIDTPGAFPGIEAEERGQAEAIAKNLYEMSNLKTPIISIIVGEGGSGGALALSVANNIIMLENSIYSVVSPEGCSSILWKDSSMASKAADYLKLTADDLKSYGVIDKIISESKSFEHICLEMKNYIYDTIIDLNKITFDELVIKRREKFREIGRYN